MPAASTIPVTKMSYSKVCRALLINLSIWLSICTVGAAGNYQDLLKEGRQLLFSRLWLSWVDNHLH